MDKCKKCGNEFNTEDMTLVEVISMDKTPTGKSWYVCETCVALTPTQIRDSLSHGDECI